MANETTSVLHIDLPLTAEEQSLLQQAAEARQKSVDEFVLESALGAADGVLKDRNVIQLSAEQWASFTAALNGQPQCHPRMERLLHKPGVFD